LAAVQAFRVLGHVGFEAAPFAPQRAFRCAEREQAERLRPVHRRDLNSGRVGRNVGGRQRREFDIAGRTIRIGVTLGSVDLGKHAVDGEELRLRRCRGIIVEAQDMIGGVYAAARARRHFRGRSCQQQHTAQRGDAGG